MFSLKAFDNKRGSRLVLWLLFFLAILLASIPFLSGLDEWANGGVPLSFTLLPFIFLLAAISIPVLAAWYLHRHRNYVVVFFIGMFALLFIVLIPFMTGMQVLELSGYAYENIQSETIFYVINLEKPGTITRQRTGPSSLQGSESLPAIESYQQ